MCSHLLFLPVLDHLVLGARVRYSARGKGHEEGGSTYAKAGSSLRSPPGTPRASTPITRACLLYYFVLPPTPVFRRFKASRASHGWEAVSNHMWPDKPLRQAREPSEEFVG